VNNIKMEHTEKDRTVFTWLIWLSAGTSGGLLWNRWWTFRFHGKEGISWLAEDLLPSQEWLCSMQLVWYFGTLMLLASPLWSGLTSERITSIIYPTGQRAISFVPASKSKWVLQKKILTTNWN
jgi:hypothetical protein